MAFSKTTRTLAEVHARIKSPALTTMLTLSLWQLRDNSHQEAIRKEKKAEKKKPGKLRAVEVDGKMSGWF